MKVLGVWCKNREDGTSSGNETDVRRGKNSARMLLVLPFYTRVLPFGTSIPVATTTTPPTPRFNQCTQMHDKAYFRM